VFKFRGIMWDHGFLEFAVPDILMTLSIVDFFFPVFSAKRSFSNAFFKGLSYGKLLDFKWFLTRLVAE